MEINLIDITTKYRLYENCHLIFGRYSNARVAIQIYRDYQLIAKATVNIPEAKLNDDEVLIKDYAENQGILQSLINNKIITNTGNVIATGFTAVNVCKLTAKALDMLESQSHE